MILKYNNNYYKYIEDKERWLIGSYTNGYTWFHYNDQAIISKAFYCGKRIK